MDSHAFEISKFSLGAILFESYSSTLDPQSVVSSMHCIITWHKVEPTWLLGLHNLLLTSLPLHTGLTTCAIVYIVVRGRTFPSTFQSYVQRRAPLSNEYLFYRVPAEGKTQKLGHPFSNTPVCCIVLQVSLSGLPYIQVPARIC